MQRVRSISFLVAPAWLRLLDVDSDLILLFWFKLDAAVLI
jgi:hypothetical protein